MPILIFSLQGENKEFVLLVSMKEGTTKTFQYDGFTFFETPITFTGTLKCVILKIIRRMSYCFGFLFFIEQKKKVVHLVEVLPECEHLTSIATF